VTVPDCPPGHGLLAGKVAVVTAAAGAGIGWATATRFANEGAVVVITDKHAKRLARALDDLYQVVGDNAAAFPCDVTEPGAIDDTVDRVVARFGRIDIVVNNAGLGGDARVSLMTDDEWTRVLDVTLTSAFRGTRAALRRMCDSGGVIVNVASVTAWRAEAGQAHYAAAKAGVAALTRCAAVEAAPYGVRVNAVAPTLAMHPFLAKVVDEATLASWAAQQPQNRHAEPHEVASVIAFLASDYASYLTGEVVSVGAQHP
jgi:3-oxoacyl-[acyl-carrier protein] reductase